MIGSLSNRSLGFIPLMAALFALAATACTTTDPQQETVSEAPALAPAIPTEGLTSRERIREGARLLGEGDPRQAQAELEAAIADQDLSTRLRNRAEKLVQQINTEPSVIFSAYNGKTFPYRVRRGDELGKISERFLEDADLFYALARMNFLEKASDLKPGQTLTIPGDRPTSDEIPPQAKPTETAPTSPPASDNTVIAEDVPPIDELTALLEDNNYLAAAQLPVCETQAVERAADCQRAFLGAANIVAANDDAEGSRFLTRAAALMPRKTSKEKLSALRAYMKALAWDPANGLAFSEITSLRRSLLPEAEEWKASAKRLYLREDDCAAAIPFYKDYLDVDPDNAQMQSHLAQCETKLSGK